MLTQERANVWRAAAACAVFAGTAAGQGRAHVVRATILDGGTRGGLSGALVQVQNASSSASGRSDDDGLVRLSLSAGTYHLIVRRIGYDPVQKEITLPDAGSEFSVSLRPQAQKLTPVRVGAKGAGIY